MVVVKEQFDPHFAETTALLLACLNENQEHPYRQFRAQIIEAITLIASAVTPAIFRACSDDIIAHMMAIQT